MPPVAKRRLDGGASVLRQRCAMPSLHDLVAPGLDILKAQQAWAVPLVFALAFARSLAVVALIVPGNAVLMGAGAMIAGGYLELMPVSLAIVMGAGLGNWLSYWIGDTFQDRIHQFKYFRKRPDLLPRGEAFFNKYGAASIVLARFIGPLRATVPILLFIDRNMVIRAEYFGGDKIFNEGDQLQNIKAEINKLLAEAPAKPATAKPAAAAPKKK